MKNRTIKFRGKRTDNGEWVYGSLIVNPYVRTNGKDAHYIFDDVQMQFFLMK